MDELKCVLFTLIAYLFMPIHIFIKMLIPAFIGEVE